LDILLDILDYMGRDLTGGSGHDKGLRRLSILHERDDVFVRRVCVRLLERRRRRNLLSLMRPRKPVHGGLPKQSCVVLGEEATGRRRWASAKMQTASKVARLDENQM
jgi:hypothetical protein